MADTINAAMREKLGDACRLVDCDRVDIVTEADGPLESAILSLVQKTGRAFTAGHKIYLPHAPDAESQADVAELAHELTHVLQFDLMRGVSGAVKGTMDYVIAGGIDQFRYSLGLGNPYTGSGFLEPSAQRVQNCFSGGSCAGSIFRPPPKP